MKRAWLITAFEPFAGRPENNSQNVLREILKLDDHNRTDPNWDFRFFSQILPCEYDRCHVVLMEKIRNLEAEQIRIEGILSLGEGAEDFKIETQANNLDDVQGFPDNRGVIRVEQKIFKNLKDTPLPLRFPFGAFSRIRSSLSPGFFVCNHLCARMSVEFKEDHHPWFGFIHVPRVGMGGIFTAEVCASVIVNSFKKIEPRS